MLVILLAALLLNHLVHRGIDATALMLTGVLASCSVCNTAATLRRPAGRALLVDGRDNT